MTLGVKLLPLGQGAGELHAGAREAAHHGPGWDLELAGGLRVAHPDDVDGRDDAPELLGEPRDRVVDLGRIT